MAEKQVKAEIMEAADVVERAKGFWAQYSRRIMIIGSIVIVVLAGYLGYKYWSDSENAKADDLVFPAEKLFGKMANASSYNKDTVNIVMNGDKASGVTGLLKIVSSYSGTKAGNRAQYMVGACYLELKQFDKAIKHLKEFDGNGALQIQSKAYLLLGHAYAEQKKTDEALDYYKKAASVSGLDETMATEALFVAGRYADAMGKTKEAIEIFTRLRDNYPASQKVTSGDADRYLGKLGVIK